MQAIGQSIHYWRIKKGLTQARVAELSGISRPNLSAIEQGARDLTVQSLRRIALALKINPGTLVDGVSPESTEDPKRFNRYSLDRIARLASGQKLPASHAEKQIAEALASVMTAKILRAYRSKTPQGVRSQNSKVLRLKVEIGQDVLNHLIRRVEKRLAGGRE